jgi:type VI secretion system protein ImpK
MADKNQEEQPKRAAVDNLALLYQPFLIAVVRVQSRREKILEATNFRSRMKSALQDVERSATVARYDFQDVKDANLAVVAFLDEVVLASEDPVRSEWMTYPLAHELMGEPRAGEVFFERLESLVQRSGRDTANLADVLEVYLVCLTLGFEGKYTGAASAELRALMERTRSRIEGIRQQRGRPLSPEARLPADETFKVGFRQSRVWTLTHVAIGAGIAAISLFLLAWAHLSYRMSQIAGILK